MMRCLALAEIMELYRRVMEQTGGAVGILNGCSPITQWLDQPARSTLSVLYTPFSQLPPSDYVCSQVRECLRKVNVGGREQLL